MNSTNRALNRILILVTGLVLLLAGACAIALAVVPGWAANWKHSSPAILRNSTRALSEQPWILITVAGIALILVLLLLTFILRQGRGRTRTLLGGDETASTVSPASGPVVVNASVAEKAIEAALSQQGELLSSNVSTFRIRKQAAMKITATPYRGASPRQVQQQLEETVSSWDRTLGRDVPVLIYIKSGLKARTSKATRIQ